MIDQVIDLHTQLFPCPSGCRKRYLVLDLTNKEYNKYFNYIIIISPTLQWIIYMTPLVWSYMTANLELQNLQASYINEQRNFHYYQHISKHYLSSIISLLMKPLLSKGKPYQNWLSQVGIITIIYGCLHSLIQPYQEI